MRQVIQSLRNGRTEVSDVPAPIPQRRALLIATSRTLISSGTERMLVEFAQSSLFQKARQQPDKVRSVLDKVRAEGLAPTIEAVLEKLDQPLPLGYCNVGRVIEVGADVRGFKVGDRVLSNGRHAEVVSVPANLCARIPDAVQEDDAAFGVLGAIALQGIRLVQPTLGEAVVVTGLGLVGLLTVQLLRAHGCRVFGIDVDAHRLALAEGFGATTFDVSGGQDPVAAATVFSRGRGVDAVIVTASTRSSEPMHQAAQMCRKRGRIVLVGVAGLQLSRADFYEKELTFQVSCSYGPGRYDPTYEEAGVDYPIGYVRWTEQRNFEAVLDMMAERRVDVRELISHRFPVAQADEAYQLIAGSQPSLGIILEYSDYQKGEHVRTVPLQRRPAATESAQRSAAGGVIGVNFIGAGNFASATLIPAFRSSGALLRAIASRSGVSGLHAGRKYGFEATTTDIHGLLSDPATDAVVITTRHDSHADLVLRALETGKHVYVEKPLCLTLGQLEAIERVYWEIDDTRRPILMIGFNRRFSSYTVRAKRVLSGVAGAKAFAMTVNAGGISPEHWVQRPDVGGGRIVGEVCHFIDLLRHLAGAPVDDWRVLTMRAATPDTVTLQMSFADGSIGSVNYFANGNRAVPKERLEVFADGRVIQLDNFRRLRSYGWSRLHPSARRGHDKGHAAAARAFIQAVATGGEPPIPPEEMFEVSRLAIEIAHAAR